MNATRFRAGVPRLFSVPLRFIIALVFALSSFMLPISDVRSEGDLETELAWVQANTVISGSIPTGIVATFPSSIPVVVVDAGFQINSRIILGEALPDGTTVTITRNGSAYLTDVVFSGTEHWVTDLFGTPDPATLAAEFDTDYAGQVETYVITFNGNPTPVDTTLTLQSIISNDGFATNVILEETQFNLTDLAVGLAEVVANTSITGMLNDLTATFPASIPQAVVDAPYRINSRITLSSPLPAGSKVSIVRDGSLEVVDETLEGAGPHWYTGLLGLPIDYAADFDGNYGGSSEHYAISISGNEEPIDTYLTIESIISTDLFTSDLVVLDAITLHVEQEITDFSLALAWVAENTTITGSLATSIVATFPTSIPSVVANAGFRINSLITLGEALPAGTLVTITRNGGAYLTNVSFAGTSQWITGLFNYPISYSAPFSSDYGGQVETYVITLSGNPEPIDTTLTLSSIISRDLFDSERIFLAEETFALSQEITDLSLALAWVAEHTTITGGLDTSIVATFPASIPGVVANAGFKVNSLLTLGQALPSGTLVTITRDGEPYLTNVEFSGTEHWITDLFGLDPSAGASFDINYGGQLETYVITLSGFTETIDTTLTLSSIISRDDFVAERFVLASETFPLSKIETTPPVLNISGATADGTPMAGSLETGFELVTTANPVLDHHIQFSEGTSASETLEDTYFGLYLSNSTVSSETLIAYYSARGVPAPYLSYLIGAVNGSNPFVYIKGSTVTLVDAAQHDIQSADTSMTVPDDYPLGTFTVSGEVRDAAGNANPVTLILVVTNPNDPPVDLAISNSLVAENAVATTVVGTLSSIDPDPGNNFAYSLVSGEGDADNASFHIFNNTLRTSQGLNYEEKSSLSVRVRTTDQGGLFFEKILTINLMDINDAPVLNFIGNKNVIELQPLSFTATAVDPDITGNSLTYTLTTPTGTVPDGAAITPEGQFGWTPTEAQGPGSYLLNICVSDSALLDCETIQVTVSDDNSSPVLYSIGNKVVNELEPLSFVVNAVDSDLPANTLTYSLEGELDGAVINSATGLFGWTPTEAQGPVTNLLVVKVCDNGTPALCDEESISINVSEVNTPPIMEQIGDRSIYELRTYTFTASATDADLPVNLLTYSLLNAPAGALIDAGSGVFTWKPTEQQGPGAYPFDVCVNDGLTSDCETITITVFEIPSPPVGKKPSGTITLKNPTFVWSVILTATQYHLVVVNESGAKILDKKLTNAGCGLFNCSYIPDPNLNLVNGKYTWKVQAYTGIWGGYSIPLVFTKTSPTLLPAPVLVRPLSGALVYSIPKYSWKAVTGAKYYQFQYALNSEFTKGVFTSPKITMLSYSPPVQPPGTYFWRVRAQDSGGSWGKWSEVRKLIKKRPVPTQ